jgi:hypothetical protein
VERVEGELLAFDVRTNRLHCLSPFAATVFESCDGNRSPAQMARSIAGPGSLAERTAAVQVALDELSARGLVECGRPRGEARTLSRRKLLMGLGLSVPLVATILAPTPAQAGTCFPSGHPCVVGKKICCGACIAGTCM